MRTVNWFIARNSNLNLESKIQIYKSVVEPIWTYGFKICNMASKSNIKKMEFLQCVTLRTILKTLWYLRNDDLRKTLEIPIVKQEIIKYSEVPRCRIKNHANQLIANYYSKRKHPSNLFTHTSSILTRIHSNKFFLQWLSVNVLKFTRYFGLTRYEKCNYDDAITSI